MKKNVGKTDKMTRLIVALILSVAIYFELIPKPWNWVALGASAILLITSAINFCPMYRILGKNTCEV
jgi:hypothetical protein